MILTYPTSGLWLVALLPVALLVVEKTCTPELFIGAIKGVCDFRILWEYTLSQIVQLGTVEEMVFYGFIGV